MVELNENQKYKREDPYHLFKTPVLTTDDWRRDTWASNAGYTSVLIPGPGFPSHYTVMGREVNRVCFAVVEDLFRKGLVL